MTVAAVNDRVTIGIDETKRRGDERTAIAVSNSALHGLQKFSGWRVSKYDGGTRATQRQRRGSHVGSLFGNRKVLVGRGVAT